ncbi:hypothetical protein NLJ89_g11179 [Agrocybe chaxingu]|uniref:Uncharacterized protein n=1 Tax=Agrocybe chaxingu TaxID=84603 RepID=A0A9W8JSV7_9AGAR|nr:hypothetical protein NLJ89_g11179 [Agrocybe chaxingu]
MFESRYVEMVILLTGHQCTPSTTIARPGNVTSAVNTDVSICDYLEPSSEETCQRTDFRKSIERATVSRQLLYSEAGSLCLRRIADKQQLEQDRPSGTLGAPGAPVPDRPVQKYRLNPRLPHDKDAEPAPSTIMYWSRASVWGAIPMRTMRAHTMTLVDTTAWLIGGCDDKDSSKDLYCFNTGTSFVSGSGAYAHDLQKRCNGPTMIQ